MAKVEIYRAQAGAELVEGALSAAAAEGVSAVVSTPYTIAVQFLGGLSEGQKAAFKSAANRWSAVIVGDLPDVRVDGETIDDLLILAQGSPIDGPSGTLGQAGPTAIRSKDMGASAFLPAKGTMTFDSADLDQMEDEGTLNDVITHEMGHVIGIGRFIWAKKNLLKGAKTGNPRFLGKAAQVEFGLLRGTGPAPVPVENRGGEGTADSHWRDSVFGNELMTGFVGDAGNPISRMTVAALQDMGYKVNLNAAEPYQLPSLASLADGGLLGPEGVVEGIVLPTIPIILP